MASTPSPSCAAQADQSLKQNHCPETIAAQIEVLVALIRSVEGYQPIKRAIPWLTRF